MRRWTSTHERERWAGLWLRGPRAAAARQKALTAVPIVTLDIDGDGIALVTLDDPERSVNVTTPELTAELLAAIDRVAADDAIRGAVITSGKPGRFVAGGDIQDFV